jgi:imidazoleglycerol-phosphate dehydratase / histidinol-phosphatase
MKKVAFLDRDGALIFEPQDTYQVDTIDQLEILPGVVENLHLLQRLDYQLAMVTNQDGLGTPSNPQANFDAVQKELFSRLEKDGIKFDYVFVCPHFPEDNCLCRKPKKGLVAEFLEKEPIDLSASLMIGDRESDRQFAENIGVRFFKTETNGHFPDLSELEK